MGIILSKFRKKESTKDILEKLQNEVLSLEEFQKNEQSRKRIVGYVIVITLLLSISAGVLYFLYYPPPTLSDKFLYVSQFAAIPIIIIIIKTLLTWFFTWRLRSNDKKLKLLKQKKKKILEEVMETETYKNAKEILEIYAPETLRSSQPYIATPVQTPRQQPHPSTELRKRMVSTPAITGRDSVALPGASSTPMSSYRPKLLPKATPNPASTHGGPSFGTPHVDSKALMKPPNVVQGHDPSTSDRVLPAGPPMPRLVVPRQRSAMDRFIEYIVGDGPTNRFALICRQCESHNGMALKDEFEYLAFRCAYCYYWNPSRKQKPLAPKLENVQPSTPLRLALQKERKISSSDEDSQDRKSDEMSDDSGSDISSDYDLPRISPHFIPRSTILTETPSGDDSHVLEPPTTETKEEPNAKKEAENVESKSTIVEDTPEVVGEKDDPSHQVGEPTEGPPPKITDSSD